MGRATRGLLAVLIAVGCAFGAGATVAHASLTVPTGGPPVSFSGSSTSGTSVPVALADFEAAAGGADNGTVAGEQGGGFRHVTWDGIAVDGTDPGSKVLSSGDVVAVARDRLQPSGLALGPEIAVANDGFTSVNHNVSFAPFTRPNVWAPFNSNVADLGIVAPAGQGATAKRAVTRGLGVVFLNVKPSGTTTVQYYNDNALLGQVSAPIGATSFAGLLFQNAVVTRVVITLGTATIFTFNGTTSPGGLDGPASNVVAADDVVLAEPTPARPAISATAGVPVTQVLDVFSETNPGATSADFGATIDWGDGTRTAGTVGPAPGATFVVTGSHAYAQAGSYTATVTVDDFMGPRQSTQTDIQVALRSSQTSVSCSPSPVAVSASTTCTATVSDVGAGGGIAPTGMVAFSSPTAGAGFAAQAGCQLGSSGLPGTSSCVVQFTPGQLPPAQARISAAYIGDGAHAASDGETIVGVHRIRCSLRALSARIGRHSRGLGVIVTCDARANVQIAVKAAVARKGRSSAFRLQFGAMHTPIGAGQPTVLVIKPARGVLAALRAAAHRHQRISLKLTLTAGSRVTRTRTSARIPALRIS